MAYLMSYTREPVNEFLYDARIAYSMHLALSDDGIHFQAMNHNSGVLFAKATENEDGSLNPKCLKNPVICKDEDGGYRILAELTGKDGEPDSESEGYLMSYHTQDFLIYTEMGLVKGESVMRKPAEGIEVLDGDHPAEGVVYADVTEIPEELAERIWMKLMPPVHIGTYFPEKTQVESLSELRQIKAAALYSDSTAVERRIVWDLKDVDFNVEGTFRIQGKLEQKHFPFPVAFNRADPCVGRWNGKYYFIATNDADDNHTLYIREADSIEGLVDAPEHLLLDSTSYEGIGGLLWAPEFHEIEGRLYIFHAATPGEFYCEESHVMELREGGNPICREDWSAPKRVVKADNTDICEAGKEITLDMTCFKWEGRYYAVWSQRQFLPKDLGAWLYIAELNAAEPWKLATDPVILSKPEYGWANNHTFVDEGPFALIRGDKIYLTFSSALVDTSYVVGMLTAEKGSNLLDRDSWRKTNYPILTSRSVEGEFGTGHNAYVEDEDGMVWNTYHARPGIKGVRSSGIRRVHFDSDGEPRLDVTEEMDIAEEYSEIETELTIIKSI